MQATSSQVITSNVSNPTVFTIDTVEDETGATILPVLKRNASQSGRDHLLVRRRRRLSRRSAH